MEEETAQDQDKSHGVQSAGAVVTVHGFAGSPRQIVGRPHDQRQEQHAGQSSAREGHQLRYHICNFLWTFILDFFIDPKM